MHSVRQAGNGAYSDIVEKQSKTIDTGRVPGKQTLAPELHHGLALRTGARRLRSACEAAWIQRGPNFGRIEHPRMPGGDDAFGGHRAEHDIEHRRHATCPTKTGQMR